MYPRKIFTGCFTQTLRQYNAVIYLGQFLIVLYKASNLFKTRLGTMVFILRRYEH